jgi:membrane protease YdiL (CAAX protease family)
MTLWVQAALRLRAGEPLLRREPYAVRPWGLVDLLLALVFQAFPIYVVGQLLQDVGNLDLYRPLEQMTREQRVTYMAASTGVSFLSWILIVCWLQVRHGCTAADFGFQWRRLPSDLRLGLAAFVMLAPIVYLIQFVLVLRYESKHPLIELLKADPDPWLMTLCGIAAVIVAPLAEETLFRLLLQSWLERLGTNTGPIARVLLGGRRLDVPAPQTASQSEPHATLGNRDAAIRVSPRQEWIAIVGSSLLFALAHFSHGPDPIPLFVLSLGLGFLFARTGRIVPSIVVHLLLNLTTMAGLWLTLPRLR